jgi:putative membrane protein
MDIQQNRKGTRAFLLAALLAAALSGCSTSREQPPAATAKAATAPAAAQPIAQPAKAKPTVTRAAPSPEESSKKHTAAILAQIHQANLKEIAIGKVAEGRASTSEVRAYADQLVQDHTNADQMVVAMAQKTGAHLHGSAAAAPAQGRHESAHRKLLDQKLSSASGSGFDRLFLQQTSSDQEKLIRTLQQEREDASDDDLEALIDKIIPILQQHHELAQILMKKEQA